MDNGGEGEMDVIWRLIRLAATALLVAMVTATAFFVGYGTGRADVYPQIPEIKATAFTVLPTSTGQGSFDVFWEAWGLLQRDYYGDLPNEQEMTYGAIRGVLGLLDDPHTGFLTPEQAQLWTADLDGSFEGIGAVVNEWPDGGVLIVEPFEGQPAWKAGLRRGDVILAVDGQDVTHMSLQEAVGLIRGPQGTSVRLLIRRADAPEPFEVEVVRARIETPVVQSKMLGGDIGYLRLAEFTASSPGKVRVALRALMALQPKGLIFDLRGNPGGLLDAAVDVASFFVPEGDVLIERWQDGEEQYYPASGRPLIRDVPLVVLVNGVSASASEIVAGAIQDSGRGLLVGEQTFGKGSVQTPHTLSDGSLLRVTTARWFTPNDRAIHGEGLTPDVVVEFTIEDAEAGRDAQLERALELLLSGAIESEAARQPVDRETGKKDETPLPGP